MSIRLNVRAVCEQRLCDRRVILSGTLEFPWCASFTFASALCESEVAESLYGDFRRNISDSAIFTRYGSAPSSRSAWTTDCNPARTSTRDKIDMRDPPLAGFCTRTSLSTAICCKSYLRPAVLYLCRQGRAGCGPDSCCYQGVIRYYTRHPPDG